MCEILKFVEEAVNRDSQIWSTVKFQSLTSKPEEGRLYVEEINIHWGLQHKNVLVYIVSCGQQQLGPVCCRVILGPVCCCVIVLSQGDIAAEQQGRWLAAAAAELHHQADTSKTTSRPLLPSYSY